MRITVVRERDASATLAIDARVDRLKSVPLFSSLHSVDLIQIGLITEERHYGDGAVIARQGNPGSESFIIASGNVSVAVVCDDGTENVVAQRGRGDCVGEMAIVQQEIRMASLIAVGKVLLLVLNQENFRTIMRYRPDTGIAVTRTLADRLIEATQYKPEQD